MTSFSADDLKKCGPTIGFYPDSAGSYVHANHVAAAGGDGYNNNADYGGTFTFNQPETYNSVFLTRKRLITAFSGYNGVPTMTTALAPTVGKN